MRQEPLSFDRAKRKGSWIPKEKALCASPVLHTRLSGASNLNGLYVMLRCRFCSIVFMHPVFVTAPAAALPLTAAAGVWVVAIRNVTVRISGSGARGWSIHISHAGNRRMHRSVQRFLLLGHPKPVFFFDKTKKKMGVWKRFPRPREADKG